MSGLPRISGRDCAKALAKAGFYFKRQHGSHLFLRRNEPFAQVVVPDTRILDRVTPLTFPRLTVLLFKLIVFIVQVIEKQETEHHQ
jgi:predicted RNA binding protein YcfA (HicA-like mRNA interferase family)